MATSKNKKRDAYLRRTYGITSRQYAQMLKVQRGRCAICSAKPKQRRLHVDHDHKTGVVRGLLCYYCNRRVVGRLTLKQAQQVVDYLLKGFDGRQIEEEATPKIRRKRPTVPQVPPDFLSPEGYIREKYIPTVWR